MLGILFIIIGYVLGSLSSAIITCKLMKLPDPREGGSGNPGATNVLRIAGKNAAMITLLGDALKGFIPVVIARLLGVDGFMLGLVALAAFLGHLYPVFFKFQGGKGAATFLGALLGLSIWIGIIAIICWFLIAGIFRFSSLASLVSATLGLVIALLFYTSVFIPLLVMTLLLIWRHWENIERLKAGTESKIEF